MKIRKELKIGLLAVAVMVTSFFVINFLRGKDVLDREIDVIGHFQDVEGLVASAPASVKGFAVGHVSSIVYRPETDDFEVVCSVKKEYRIPVDSRMVIYSTSIMGTKGVKIEQGTSSELVKSGDVITAASESDVISSITGLIAPLAGKIESALDSLTAVLAGVNDVLNEQNKRSIQSSLRHLNSTLASASELARSLNGKSDEINAIVENLSQLSAKLGPIVESTQGTMSNIEDISAKLNEADIKSAVENIGAAAGTLNSTVNTISQPLDSLLNDVDDLVKSIKENPKKYIKVTVF